MVHLANWRIVARYRQWIGKPDPNHFGEFFVYSNDQVWIRKQVKKLRSEGHKILRIEYLQDN